MRTRLIRFLTTACIGLSIASAAAARPNDQVYQVNSSSCGLKNNAFLQTGFRAVVQGQVGLVTALHGVVGCKNRFAVQEAELGGPYIADLVPLKVSVAHDVIFFASPSLAQRPGAPLRASGRLDAAGLMVRGYPLESRRQLDTPVSLYDQSRTTLRRQFGASDTVNALARRDSPSVDVDVLLIRGAITSGHSGAPILTPSGEVVGIANGGLALGSTDITWAIPFDGLPWTDYDASSPAILKLAAMDAASLFHSPRTGGSDRPRTGATVSGTIVYNGRPAGQTSRALAVIELMDLASRNAVPVDVTYDNGSGRFSLANVPPGKYLPFVRIEAGYPFYIESGGDYLSRISGLNPDIVVAPHDTDLQIDLEVVHGIHLRTPVDNQARRRRSSDPLEAFHANFYAPTAEVFEWDPVPGADRYTAHLRTVRGSGQLPLNVIERQLKQPRFLPGLAVSPPGTHYMFRVEAFNAAGKRIGTFFDYFKDGSGGWLEFTVTPGRRPVTQPVPPQASHRLQGILVVPGSGPIGGLGDLPSGSKICALRDGAAVLRSHPAAANHPVITARSSELFSALQQGICAAVFVTSAEQAQRLFPPRTTGVRHIAVSQE